MWIGLCGARNETRARFGEAERGQHPLPFAARGDRAVCAGERVGFELDVKFTAMGTPGILTQLRATDLLLDGVDVGQGEHVGADALTDVEHLIERGSWDGTRNLHHKMPLAKVGHE